MSITPPDMLCFALYSASHAMQAAYQPLLAPLGLTYPQYLVLSALDGASPQRVGQLGATLDLDTNTLTPMLKRMEGAGWLTRRRDDRDERQVLVALTPEGRNLLDRAADVPDCFARKTGLAQTDIADLRDVLAALRDQLRGRSGT